jgi:hypothetical protein
MSRLTALHVHLIGVFVAVAVAAGLYFTLIPKATQNVKDQKKAADDVHAIAITRGAKEAALKKAKADKVVAEGRFKVYQSAYFPAFNYKAGGLATMRTVWWPNRGKSWPERFIRAVRTHMALQSARNGVVWLNPGVVSLPATGPDPNTMSLYNAGDATQPVYKYVIPISVQAKNMDRLMRHIQAWYRIRNAGVPVVEGLQIAGNSPNLQAQYTVTLTIIMRDKLPAPEPRIGGVGGGPAGARPGMMGAGGAMGALGAQAGPQMPQAPPRLGRGPAGAAGSSFTNYPEGMDQ